jgi:hypothetical protein
MSGPLNQLAKVLGLLGSHHDGEIPNAGKRAHSMLISNDWTWPQLLANGSAATLSEEQVQKIFSAGMQRGESVGYQRGLADAQALAPVGAKPAHAEIQDDVDWLGKILVAAAAAEAEGHLNPDEVDFTGHMRSSLTTFGRRTYCSQRQRNWLRVLEKSLRRRGYL